MFATLSMDFAYSFLLMAELKKGLLGRISVRKKLDRGPIIYNLLKM